MDIGLLVLLNLSSIPFLSEFESIGCSGREPLAFRSVLRLRQFLRT